MNTFVIFISRILAQLAAGFMGGNRDEGEESNGNPLIHFGGCNGSGTGVWYSWRALSPCGSLRHREFHADAGFSKPLVGESNDCCIAAPENQL